MDKATFLLSSQALGLPDGPWVDKKQHLKASRTIIAKKNLEINLKLQLKT